MEGDTKNSSRGKGRVRGRGKKKAADPEKSIEESNSTTTESKSNDPEAITLDLDADITQLEAPTFSTINKGPPEPMLRLNWDHKTHLIGEKVINPMIHCCDKCHSPILIYGRMIPCKHVFCLTCAESENEACPRCQEKVVRVEKTGLGTVFMCTFGGTRYGSTGCRRTYLSQRDLLAHINHRHIAGSNVNKENLGHNQSTPSSKPVPAAGSRPKPTIGLHHMPGAGDPRVLQSGSSHEYFYKMHSSPRPLLSTPTSHRQAHYQHSTAHHHRGEHLSSATSSALGFRGQTTAAQQPSQRLLASTQPLVPPPDFPNHILVPNYPPPSTNSMAPVPAIRSTNLIAIQTRDTGLGSRHSSVDLSIATSFPPFPSPFTGGSAGIPFPVPPPSQSAIGTLSQTTSQFYSNTSINYTLTSTQRTPVTQFRPNSPGPSLMSPAPLIPPSTPQMVPPPRRNQFSRESTSQQSFPGTQNHRWHQSSQSQFF